MCIRDRVVVCAYTLLIYAASFYLTDANGVMVISDVYKRQV